MLVLDVVIVFCVFVLGIWFVGCVWLNAGSVKWLLAICHIRSYRNDAPASKSLCDVMAWSQWLACFLYVVS